MFEVGAGGAVAGEEDGEDGNREGDDGAGETEEVILRHGGRKSVGMVPSGPERDAEDGGDDDAGTTRVAVALQPTGVFTNRVLREKTPTCNKGGVNL